MLLALSTATAGSRLEFFDINLPVFRIVIIFTLIRLFILEKARIAFGPLDRAVVYLSFATITVSIFQPQLPGFGFVFTVGNTINGAGSYFVFRALISNSADLSFFLKSVAIVFVPISLGMLYEQLSGRNVFAIMGGISEHSLIRNERIRSQGPFNHPILAGTIGASIAPLALWLYSQNKIVSLTLILHSLTIVFASSSSGPVVSYLVAIGTFLFFRFRHTISYIPLFLFFGYLFLAAFMTRPPYYLLAHIDLASGSTGWYRAALIEATIEHFDEWWLKGVYYTRHWIDGQPGINPDQIDVTNQFVAYCIGGGLIGLILYLNVNYSVYRLVRDTSLQRLDHNSAKLIWATFSTFVCFLTATISVSFFGQALVFFWFSVALVQTFSTPNQVSPNGTP